MLAHLEEAFSKISALASLLGQFPLENTCENVCLVELLFSQHLPDFAQGHAVARSHVDWIQRAHRLNPRRPSLRRALVGAYLPTP